MKNGNKYKGSSSMKIMQWNKGSSSFRSKIPIIKQQIERHKPDVYIVNEAEIREKDEETLDKIDGYRMEKDNLMMEQGVNRTIIYIKLNLSYNRLKQYEAKNESTISLSIGFYNQKRVIITGFYRQWKLPKNIVPRSYLEQNKRMENQTNLWRKMIESNTKSEIIFMGDFNLDPKLLNIRNEDKTKNQKNYNIMWEQMKSKILENGITIMNSKNIQRQGNQESQLDLIKLQA